MWCQYGCKPEIVKKEETETTHAYVQIGCKHLATLTVYHPKSDSQEKLS